MARYGKKSLSLVLTLVLLLGLLTGPGLQAAAAELPQYTADGTMTELAEGAKTAAGTYSIADAAELRALSAWINAGNTGEGFTFFLTADIDLGGKDSPWVPIGQLDGNLGDTDVKAAFFGTFDGQGRSVTGLWVGGDDYTTGSGRYNAANGLFGVNFGTVMNVFAEVEIIPGITAACSGAAVLGAPVSHDLCIISLSDLLTPWNLIEKRLKAAAEGDFCIVLYNPASHKRADYLKRACEILMSVCSPDTVCGFVRNIGREGTECKICTLRELADEKADMFVTVFIGNSMTKSVNGKMITPRGYELK